MAKLSAEEQAQLDSLQQKQAAEDDEALEVWVENGDGHKTKLTGERAANWLTRNGYDAEAAEESSAAEPLSAAKTTSGAPPAKTAPKKATAKTGEQPAGDTGEEAGEGELQQDAPAQRTRRYFV